MPIHHANQELRLRHIKVGLPSFALHETCRLLAGPSPLRFVEHDDLLKRDIIVADILVSEMMNILNEAAHGSLSSLFRDTLASSFVASKSFSEHFNKRAVARQKNGMLIVMFLRAPSRDI
jgi:hypothetical protein